MESVSVQLGVQFGSVPTDTVDVLLPDPTYSNPPAADQVRSILYEASQLLSCYPRAALALLSGRQKQYLGRPSADSTIEYRAGREAVLFVHGGGFVCVESEYQLHQATALARAGFTVFSLDYPHAPESPFPEPVLAVLRCLAWLKAQGYNSVSMLGESAGATLVCHAALLLSSNPLCAQFSRQHCTSAISTASMPKISSLVCWYGILDSSSWTASKQSTMIGKCFGQVLSWCFSCYAGKPNRTSPAPLTLCDIARGESGAAALAGCPPILLIAGDKDPLYGSTEAAAALLEASGVHYQFKLYPARHAFIGLNPFILFFTEGCDWRQTAIPATHATVEWLKQHRCHGGV